ncbi:MYXO-CTERM sorting domain-containing protein [Pyxidicoccus sp. MSG2]|uniref:MYXO-CTERM sorting domain-containing protein n=1 Tax=Pyxidicoccus sp. MSG2 TaxID=2996790 RepID=UPI0022703A30|nr:MYXO-CTERM sorting domain-containing protein [Pyxidicoccus sp. MSG2]MCY1022168.1 MYXO-CTERM sorting domain-containing protein [Pyxidicoccus sp. MSG2]
MRAAIVFIFCMGMATAASAGVEIADVAGFPRYVDVWRPGVYSVSSTQKVELWNNGAVDAEFFEADVFGTFLSPSGCFAAVKLEGTLVSNGNCLPSGTIIPPGESIAPQVRRVRFTPSGTGYATVKPNTTDLQLLTTLPANTGGPEWNTLTIPGGSFSPTSVMGVTDTDGGVPHVLFYVVTTTTDFLWYRGRDFVAEVDLPANLLQEKPTTVDLIATEGPDPVAIFGSDAGLFRGQLTPPTGPGHLAPFLPVTILDGGTAVRIVSVDVNTGQGSARGEGYGVAVGLGDSDEFVLLGAVPTDSAADAGTLWRVNPKVDTSSLPKPLEVACAGSAFCVISLDSPGEGSGNLRLYTNEAAPGFVSGTQSLEIYEAGGAVQRRITATDDDGDAVRVSVDSAAAAGLFNVRAGLQPDTLDLEVTPLGDVCKTETRELDVFASDGLASHDQSVKVRVTLNNVRGPEVPGVTPTNAAVVAGGAPRVFTATPPGSGPCATVGYRWTSTSTTQPELAVSPDGTATFTPPDTLCVQQGERYTYTVQGLDEGGLASPLTSFSVDVAPWGPPLAPFGPGAVRALASGPGSGTDVTAEAPLHTCTGTPGLPGVQTVWRLSDSSAGVPPAFTVRAADGGTVSLESPVESPRLRVEAVACTRASLSFTAFNRIQTDAGGVQDGPEATVRVDAVPAVEDITAAQLQLTAVPAEQGQVDIQLGTSVLCPAEYALKAQMSLRNLDGGTLAGAVVDVPGSWRPPLPDDCSARDYIVHGQLFDESTGTRLNGGTAQTLVSAQALPAALGALEGEALVAHCGERATATLTQTIPSNACQAVDITWTQVGGPALAEAELGGAQVTVATRDTGLEGLVGESVVLSVTADAGGGNSTTTQHVVPITTAPFVDVTHETESQIGAEKSLVGVVVQLRNDSGCQVGSLRHVEHVDGVDWVPGSVKVDGRTVAEQAVEGGFVVDGVTLPAGGTSALTYVARPRLLASPRFGGEVFLNGVQVSGPLPPVPSSGCGCSSGDAGSALLGLLALARLLRRRRDGAAG